MSVHPILFNTEMVRAILAGRKTVTRRVVKPPVPKPCELRKMQEGYHAGEWHLYCEDPLLDEAADAIEGLANTVAVLPEIMAERTGKEKQT